MTRGNGLNDGSTPSGRILFRCKPKHGLFVEPSLMMQEKAQYPPQSASQKNVSNPLYDDDDDDDDDGQLAFTPGSAASPPTFNPLYNDGQLALTLGSSAVGVPPPTNTWVVVRARCHVPGRGPGTVRWIGAIREEDRVGVELDEPNGLNDGSTPSGRIIFRCKPKHGLFVKPSIMMQEKAQPERVFGI